jgi:hypothetical protein
MQTKVFAVLGAVLGMALVAPGARANSIVLTQGAYSFDVGGEFTAVTSPGSFLANYGAAATMNGGFQTFCIETSVEFTPGTSYSYALSQSDSLGRPLTDGTAFLYYEFAQGTLQGYDYTHAASRLTDAGKLQAAIWLLQGGQTYPGYPTGGTGNPFYDLAVSTLGGNLLLPSDGKYGVAVLQLADANGAVHQNQLVCVPDGGATFGMLAAGLLALGVLQYKNRLPSHHQQVPAPTSRGLAPARRA